MKSIERVFRLIVVCVVLVGCAALGVPPQSTAPSVNQAITDIPSSIPEQITFPQMTGTALAVPTVPFVIEPTQTPVLPGANDPIVVSPNGRYAIACKEPFFILLDVQTNRIISTFDYFPVDCVSNIHWASDSSYALFGVLYRWRIDGSQPEFLDIHVDIDPNDYACFDERLYEWSLDEKYLAVKKCGISVVVRPFDESSLKNPLLISDCCVEGFRWATPRLLMVDYFRTYSFVQIPSGNGIGWLGRSGGICSTAQIPLISPNEQWMTFDAPWCGGGEPGPNEYKLANLEDGSVQVFSQSFADGIDFIGWNKDGSAFYMISRPTEINAQADPRTPFGLLTMNPQTLQTQNLFEQAWYVAFNDDMSWAYVIFSSKNENGSLRLDGGLWEVGTTRLIGRQVMAHSLEETFLNPYSSPDTAYMYSPSGQELGFSADTRIRRLPAAWSHDNTRVATVNPEHQLIVITLNGDIQVVGKLDDIYLWINTVIKWSDDDKVLDVDGVKWAVP